MGAREGKLAFVDASPDPHIETVEAGGFDLGALLARIEHAVQQGGREARRRSTRSARCSRSSPISRSCGASCSASRPRSRRMGVTAILTAERTEDYGPVARFGVEEFIADNVMILRNVLEDEKRRRTIEILKFRGTRPPEGRVPVHDRSRRRRRSSSRSRRSQLQQKSSNVRISSGNAELDEMCGGGFFRDSVILVSGATGTGKTLTVTQFLQGGADARRALPAARLRGEPRAALPQRERLGRRLRADGARGHAARWSATTPRSAGLEDWLITIQAIIEEFKPNRVAVDSLSALERVGTVKAFREFVIGLTSFIKHQEITGLFTSTTRDADGRRRRSPRRTSRRSPTRSSCCATSRCSAR